MWLKMRGSTLYGLWVCFAPLLLLAALPAARAAKTYRRIYAFDMAPPPAVACSPSANCLTLFDANHHHDDTAAATASVSRRALTAIQRNELWRQYVSDVQGMPPLFANPVQMQRRMLLTGVQWARDDARVA